MIFVTIEGNIGVGKSTVLELLRQRSDGTDVVTIAEPIDAWRSPLTPDGATDTPLSMLYADPAAHGFAFQMYATHTRMECFVRALGRRPTPSAIVMERSCMAEKDVFGTVMRPTMDPLQWRTYQTARALVREMAGAVDPGHQDVTIYLRASPDECLKRMQRRGRPEECENVRLEYLQDLHDLHERFFFQGLETQVQVIDGTLPPHDVCDRIEAVLAQYSVETSQAAPRP